MTKTIEEFTKIKFPPSYEDRTRCGWCNKPLAKIRVSHINICQEPKEREFCSRDCKNNWCYKEQMND